jgi:hypothetical protein
LPARTLYMRWLGIEDTARSETMQKNKEFAVLVGRAFLHEVEAGHIEAAVAFGRAFLLSLGMRGPSSDEPSTFSNGKQLGEHLAVVHN